MTAPNEELVTDNGEDKEARFLPASCQLIFQVPSFAQLPESPDIGDCPVTEVRDRARRESRGRRGLGLELGDGVSTGNRAEAFGLVQLVAFSHPGNYTHRLAARGVGLWTSPGSSESWIQRWRRMGHSHTHPQEDAAGSV